LSFIINSKVNIQRSFSIYPSCEYALLWSVQPPLLLPFTPSLPPSIIQQLSVNIVISSICTSVKYFNIVGYHFLLLSLLPLAQQFNSTITNVFYTIMFDFVYTFIFCICLLHVREKWLLFFWAWLTSLNMISSNSIYLPSNQMVSFFSIAE
jgi:hypothetical protein